MRGLNQTRSSYFFLAVVTTLSFLLIITNALLGMQLEFRVEFLIGFIGLLLVFVVWHSIQTKGLRCTATILCLSFLIAFSSEALGVNYGLIYGSYHYTKTLGFQVLGVPLLAALAWEPILYAAFSLTTILTEYHPEGTLMNRIPAYLWLSGVGALATTAWDMMIDPIAVSQQWWVWENGGAYVPYLANGVPISNFMGWLGVSFTIHLVYRLITNHTPVTHSSYLDIYGPVTLYAALFLTASGVAISVLGRPEIALVGLLAMGPFLAIGFTNININNHRSKKPNQSKIPAPDLKT
jgi:uncharacterized membrane protein